MSLYKDLLIHMVIYINKDNKINSTLNTYVIIIKVTFQVKDLLKVILLSNPLNQQQLTPLLISKIQKMKSIVFQ